MTIDELLCKFQGKCWHIWVRDWRGLQTCSKCGIDRIYNSIKNNYANDNPDFSDDRVAMELLKWMHQSRIEMMEAFDGEFPLTAYDFINRLEREDKSYMYWVVLLAEWLRLEETREKWGTERCVDCRGTGTHKYEDECGDCLEACPACSGSGKIRSAWAREEG